MSFWPLCSDFQYQERKENIGETNSRPSAHAGFSLGAAFRLLHTLLSVPAIWKSFSHSAVFWLREPGFPLEEFMYRHIPLRHPRPNAQRFIDGLMGRFKETKPRMVEYLVDGSVMKPVVTSLLGREWVDTPTDVESRRKALDIAIEFWYRMGYDFIRIERGLVFPKHSLRADDVSGVPGNQRTWADEHQGMIRTWEDFEKYPWPRLEDCDFFDLEYVSRNLPDGMGLIASHGGGPFEQLSQIFSLEGLALALYDDPDLVTAVNDKIGNLMTGFYRHLVQLDNLVAVFPGDDMGFRTGTMIAPAHLRAYTLPVHTRVAEIAHERGLPYFLHSCGNVLPIVEDLINDVKLDGKHSFEDAIIPIQDFQREYGEKLAVLGGMDIDLLAAGSVQDVRKHVRFLMETCGARGRFALGSGSSIPNYVPVANYLAMLDEAIDFSS